MVPTLDRPDIRVRLSQGALIVECDDALFTVEMTQELGELLQVFHYDHELPGLSQATIQMTVQRWARKLVQSGRLTWDQFLGHWMPAPDEHKHLEFRHLHVS